ncbi:Homoserine dehydrogenase [Penicillium hispanicum]|uniref:Homoserine dehydrogenase n=1 Tax=Penicillium hispanicum TaxID=1080232 RepID=UPI0025403E01|nr:Homoserine dehydrogenase [Penicillium hispanicum]KAJ5569665.1 Homoserine dehydrogenase [Penicillium hispanicum]
MSGPIYLGIVGVGGVGNALLEQLGQIHNAPKLVLLSRSSHTLLVPTPAYSPCIPFVDWDTAAATPSINKVKALTPEEIATYLASAPGRAILVDNTSNLALAQQYPIFLKQGISIVTPNKKGFADELSLWDDIFASAAQGNALVYHQATVGGSLPVLSTLRDLIATGDEIIRIEGVLSGTLSLLFDTYMPAADTSDTQWSALVTHALEIGFMEPDPRDDLNGMDFARKLTILARVVGLQVARPESFPVESLIPAELVSLPSSKAGIARFMDELPKFDGRMALARKTAQEQGKVIRYVGSIDVPGKAIRVGLQHLDKGNPIANLNGSQIVSIYTKRYGATPLVLKGGGGGGEVTAMCVMADLLKLLERLR